jgi:hypothetical protein
METGLRVWKLVWMLDTRCWIRSLFSVIAAEAGIQRSCEDLFAKLEARLRRSKLVSMPETQCLEAHQDGPFKFAHSSIEHRQTSIVTSFETDKRSTTLRPPWVPAPPALSAEEGASAGHRGNFQVYIKKGASMAPLGNKHKHGSGRSQGQIRRSKFFLLTYR